jgi:hypothetical protein
MRGWRLSTGLRRLEGVPGRAGRLRSREATCAIHSCLWGLHVPTARLGLPACGRVLLRITNHESRMTLLGVLHVMYALLCASEQLQLVAVHVNTSSWTIASVF